MEQVRLGKRQTVSKVCRHTAQAREVSYARRECLECVALSDTWVHLRLCMVCGHVGCCDSSKNKHARTHYVKTGHPIVRTIQPGEDWASCFVEDAFL